MYVHVTSFPLFALDPHSLHFKSLPRLLSWDGAGEVALNRAAIIFRISANYLHFISENAGAKLKQREFLKKYAKIEISLYDLKTRGFFFL